MQKSPRLNKGRNFKRASRAMPQLPQRGERLQDERGGGDPHQYLVSHVQGFYLKCNESLRGGLGGEVTHANFCFKMIVLAVVWRHSGKEQEGKGMFNQEATGKILK